MANLYNGIFYMVSTHFFFYKNDPKVLNDEICVSEPNTNHTE